MKHWELKQMQGLPLEAKIVKSQLRITEWYTHWHGDVYVAFSGGKDSTVLLHMVRELYPEVPAVFCDTGLEYPEIRNFVKTFENVIWLKPKYSFKEIIEKYGYPVISKSVSMAISRFRNTKIQEQKEYRLGHRKGKAGTIPKKWQYLLNAPFKISDECCHYLKKEPSIRYDTETSRKPYLGMMAVDSDMRKNQYLIRGCNAYEGKASSWPLGFWTDEDIWKYIRTKRIQYCSLYDNGCDRTGCMFCLFGCHLEPSPNRFQRMALTHPAQYKYCMQKLGLAKVLDYMNIPYKPYVQQTLDPDGVNE